MFFNLMSTFDGVTCVLALFVVIFVDQECLIQFKQTTADRPLLGRPAGEVLTAKVMNAPR